MNKVVYSKYSNERNRRFALVTEIIENEEQARVVYKKACYPQGREHVENIYLWYKRFTEEFKETNQNKLSFNKCRKFGNTIELEYLYGKTLEEVVDEILEEKGADSALEIVYDYIQLLRQIFETSKFQISDRFREVFGDVELPEGLKCAKVSNIDMLLENVIVSNTWTVIDYEWCFDFPIPSNYIIYRVLHYYLETHSKRAIGKTKNPYAKVGITQEEILSYQKMERNFQTYITAGHTPIRELYGELCPGLYEMPRQFIIEMLQVYYSFGNGFCEADSIKIPMRKNQIDTVITLPEGVTDLRIDPGNNATMLRIKKLCYDISTKEIEKYQASSCYPVGEWLCMGQQDPNLTLVQVPRVAKELLVNLEIKEIDGEILEDVAKTAKKAKTAEEQLKEVQEELREQKEKEKIRQREQKKKEKEQEIQLQSRIEELEKQLRKSDAYVSKLSRKIQEMENTKVWKAYRKYRDTIERK